MAKAAERDCLEGIGLSNKHGPARTAVLMHREGLDDVAITSLASSLGVRVLCLADIMNSSKPIQDSVLPNLTSDTLATIVYTSGTTGRPKGVMLSHGNLLHQITLRFAPSKPYDKSEPLPDDVMVTMLPVWHITERAAELCIFSRGCKLVYSSVKHLKADLAIHKPHWMMLVPRVLEKISLGVQEKFAKKSKLARVMIHFFTMIAAAKNEHLKIAKGQVIGKKKPNLLRRLFARCIATLLTPLDLLGTALVWGKVKQALGGRQKLIVSGGSALSGKIEDFFSNIGVLLIVGYGEFDWLSIMSSLFLFVNSDNIALKPQA
jgi:long-chain acyl-CoA synthetase